jgi:hypothetical protein
MDAEQAGTLSALQSLQGPESEYNGSATLWDDGDCYVIQGWRITDLGHAG